MKTFIKQGKLTSEGVAVYAEAMKFNRVAELPKELYHYVQNHPEARQRIVRLYRQIKDAVPQSIRKDFRNYLKIKYPIQEERKMVYLGSRLKFIHPKKEDIFINQVHFELEHFNLLKEDKEESLLKRNRPNSIAPNRIHQSFHVTIQNSSGDIQEEFECQLKVPDRRFSISTPPDKFPTDAYYWTVRTSEGFHQSGYVYLSNNQDLYHFISAISEKNQK